MTPLAGTPLFMLAFDQRGSFNKGLFGIESTPTLDEAIRIADCKPEAAL